MAANDPAPDSVALSPAERELLAQSAADARARAAAAAHECAARIANFAQITPAALQQRPLPPDVAILRDCVGTYVRALRAMSTTPEQALVQVKTLLIDVTQSSSGGHRALTQAVVSWAIEAYYATH